MRSGARLSTSPIGPNSADGSHLHHAKRSQKPGQLRTWARERQRRCGHNKAGPTRPTSATGPPRATFHHGPEILFSNQEAENTTAVHHPGTVSYSEGESRRRKNKLTY